LVNNYVQLNSNRWRHRCVWPWHCLSTDMQNGNVGGGGGVSSPGAIAGIVVGKTSHH